MVYNIIMKINKEFFNYIKPILVKLKSKIGNDFVIFGSTPLYLFGVVEFTKEINDIDVALKDKVNLPSNAKVVTFQGDTNKKFHKINIDGVNIDIGCEWEGWSGQKEFFKKLFKEQVVVDGYKFVNINVIEEWKKEMVKKYNREKDKKYLKQIKEYKTKQKDEQ